MGPAARFGLCLVLSALPPAALGGSSEHGCPPGYEPPPGVSEPPLDPGSCDDINECMGVPPPCGPHQSCTNFGGGFNCSCDGGYREEPPPAGEPPQNRSFIKCVDVDECEEGEGLCGGGRRCFNTPGGFECHCPPGTHDTPQGGCSTPVTEPPKVCAGDESGCLAAKLTHLQERLEDGGDPPKILQELLVVLDAALVGGGGAPRNLGAVSELLAAAEGLLGGAGARLPPSPTQTSITLHGSELRLAKSWGPPPAPLKLSRVQLDVTGGGHNDTSVVALLSLGGLAEALTGSPLVRWGGWGELPPPPRSEWGRPSYKVLSPVATALASPRPAEVTLSFRHPPPEAHLGGRVLCAFWDPRELLWATEGCREVPPLPRHIWGAPPGGDLVTTSCACDHLTSFAVLLAFREIDDHWVLDLVTKVGLGVSVLSLGVAAATFLLCRAIKGLRTTLHLHLSLSLLLAHGTFLLGIERTHHPAACAAVAGLLHFFFLSAFAWMCLEGLHLYVLLVRVFVPSWLRVQHLLLVGYGLPALVVAVSAAAFPGGYGTDRYCWLSLKRGFRWSFQAPVCIVIAVNAVILVVTIWKLVQKFSDVTRDMGHLRRMRALVLTGVGQLCLLGSGWALGLGLGGGGAGVTPPGGPPSALPLLFCALNASQGIFILLCHCLAHPQVREAYRACLCPGAQRYSTFTSNTSNTQVSH